jgi:hypothetical protein
MLGFSEYDKIHESIKQAKQYLSTKEIETDNNPVLARLSELLKKKPNLIGNFVKYHYEENISLEELTSFIQYMTTNKATVGKLPKALIDYDKFEYIQDDLRVVERGVKANKLYGYLHPELRADIAKLPEQQKNDLDSLVIDFMDLPEEKRKAFTPLKFFRENKTSVSDFSERMRDFVENLDSGRERIEQALEEHENKYEIVYNQDNILIVKGNDRELVKAIGSEKWCIVYAQDTYYNRYLAPSTNNTHYTIFNFNYSLSNRYGRFGVTIAESGKPSYGGCQDNLNTNTNIEDIAKSLSVGSDVLEKILINDYSVKKHKVINLVSVYADTFMSVDMSAEKSLRSFKDFLSKLHTEYKVSYDMLYSFLNGSVFGTKFAGVVNTLWELGFSMSDFDKYMCEYIISLANENYKYLTYEEVVAYKYANKSYVANLFINESRELLAEVKDAVSLAKLMKYCLSDKDAENRLSGWYTFRDEFTKRMNVVIEEHGLVFAELESSLQEFVIRYATDRLMLDFDDIAAHKQINRTLSSAALNSRIKAFIAGGDYSQLVKYLSSKEISPVGLHEHLSYENARYFSKFFDAELRNGLVFGELTTQEQEYAVALSYSSSELTYFDVAHLRNNTNNELMRMLANKHLETLISKIHDVESLTKVMDFMTSVKIIEMTHSIAFTTFVNNMLARGTDFNQLGSELRSFVVRHAAVALNITYEQAKEYKEDNPPLFKRILTTKISHLSTDCDTIGKFRTLLPYLREYNSSHVNMYLTLAIEHLLEVKAFFPNFEEINSGILTVTNEFIFSKSSMEYKWSDAEPYLTDDLATFLIEHKEAFLWREIIKDIPKSILLSHFHRYVVDAVAKGNDLPLELDWHGFYEFLNADSEDASQNTEYVSEYIDNMISVFYRDNAFISYVIENDLDVDFEPSNFDHAPTVGFFVRYSELAEREAENSLESLILYQHGKIAIEAVEEQLGVEKTENGDVYIEHSHIDELCDYYDNLDSFELDHDHFSYNVNISNESLEFTFLNLKRIANHLVGFGFEFDLTVFQELGNEETEKFDVAQTATLLRDHAALMEISDKIEEILKEEYMLSEEEEENGVEDYEYELGELRGAVTKAYEDAYAQNAEDEFLTYAESLLSNIGFVAWENGSYIKHEDDGSVRLKVDMSAPLKADYDYANMNYEIGDEFDGKDLLRYYVSENEKLHVYEKDYYAMDDDTMNDILYQELGEIVNERVVIKFRNYVKLLK